MDVVPKERKLASATVRKQRKQERPVSRDFVHEQREERRRRQVRYSEVYATDSGPDSMRSDTPENDSAAETPSESSVRTPDNSFSPEVEFRKPTLRINSHRSARKEGEQNRTSTSTLIERRRSRMKPSKPVALGPSLNHVSDFRYDRFSTIVEPIDTQVEKEDESSSSGEDEEDYSPIEVARPIAIRMPIHRPSVVSVTGNGVSGGGAPRFSVKNINTIMVNPPRPATSSLRQIESSAEANPFASHNASSFVATEAKPHKVAAPYSESVISIEQSFERSSVRSPSPASVRQEAPRDSMKKKSSMDLFGKFRHTRMHSIKNFIKTQSLSGPPPAMPEIPTAHQTRPLERPDSSLSMVSSRESQIFGTTNTDRRRPGSPWRSVTEPGLPRGVLPHQARPGTAHVRGQHSISILPYTSTVPSPVSRPQTPMEQAGGRSLNKKLSFANLRRRSGSLGQALRFSSSRGESPIPEAPLPPLPVISAPTRESMQSSRYATPPPQTPRSVRRGGMGTYSPFPPATPRGEPVGLGLRI